MRVKKTYFVLILTSILLFNLLLFDNSPSIESDRTTTSFNEISIANSDPIEYIWNQTWGGESSDDHANTIALDSLDNIYIAGYSHPIRGGGNTLLLKYDNLGTLTWTQGLGSNFVCLRMVIDSNDKIYLIGYVFGFENHKIGLAKYNSSGDLQWNHIWNATIYEHINDIALDSAGNIYIVGRTTFLQDVGNDYLLKFNSSGVLEWNRTSGSFYMGVEIELDSSDNIYIAGRNFINETLDTIPSLNKYDSSGYLQWKYIMGQDYLGSWPSFVIDSKDKIYLAGYTGEHLSGYKSVISKFNDSGALEWNQTFAGVNFSIISIALDSNNNIYTIGRSRLGANRLCLIKYNPLGEIQWQHILSLVGLNRVTLILDTSDNIYIGGTKDADVYLGKFTELKPISDLNSWILIIILYGIIFVPFILSFVIIIFKRYRKKGF